MRKVLTHCFLTKSKTISMDNSNSDASMNKHYYPLPLTSNIMQFCKIPLDAILDQRTTYSRIKVEQ